MERLKKHLYVNFLSVFIIICLLLVMLEPIYSVSALEKTTTYSGVLEDLAIDTSFNPNNYPENDGDYSIKVMQVAESTGKELFVYAYQPSGNSKGIVASSINISTTINDDISFYNYKLVLLNSNGVFYKYRVENFEVNTLNAVRYYVISVIYRNWNEQIDAQASGDNKISEVNYQVAKQFCLGTINGNHYCSVVDIETIVVTDKFVGFVRYKDGFNLYVGACDSHFVAFNTDRPIDKLLEADVYYASQSYNYSFTFLVGEKTTFGDKKDNYAYLKYTDKVTHAGRGLFAGTYSWDRIQSVNDFIASENTENIYSGAVLDVKTSTQLTASALEQLKGKQWVLRFAETDYSLNSNSNLVIRTSTIISDVTILRLKFESDGITYNLGVIDNKQTGGITPSNETNVEITLNDKGKNMLYIILAILLALALIPLLPYIIRGLHYLIKLPYRLIDKIIKWIKANKHTRKRK